MMQNGKWFSCVLGNISVGVSDRNHRGVHLLTQFLKVHDKVLKTKLRLHVDEDDPIIRAFPHFSYHVGSSLKMALSWIVKPDLK